MSSTYIVKDSKDNIIFVSAHYEDTRIVASEQQGIYAFVDLEEWDGAYLLRTFRFIPPKDDWNTTRDYVTETRNKINHLNEELKEAEQTLREMTKGEN